MDKYLFESVSWLDDPNFVSSMDEDLFREEIPQEVTEAYDEFRATTVAEDY